ATGRRPGLAAFFSIDAVGPVPARLDGEPFMSSDSRTENNVILLSDLRAATDAANWFLSTVFELVFVLDRRFVVTALSSAATEDFCRKLRELQGEVFPSQTAGHGGRKAAIEKVSAQLDVYGPVNCGTFHASNAHLGALDCARRFLRQIKSCT